MRKTGDAHARPENFGAWQSRSSTVSQNLATAWHHIKFGTDGWRAVIAEDFTFANVARVAQATADYWSANPVAGHGAEGHRRLRPAVSSPTGLRRRAAEVFAGNGFQVVLTPEPTPTPSVSFAVKAQRAVGGVMITASHNPPMFNGFKLKSHYGGSSESDTCQAVEGFLDRNPVRVDERWPRRSRRSRSSIGGCSPGALSRR